MMQTFLNFLYLQPPYLCSLEILFTQHLFIKDLETHFFESIGNIVSIIPYAT